MNAPKIVTVAVAALMVTACTSDGNQKQQLGQIVGAGLGALAGSQVGSGRGQLAAVAVGALAGAYVGTEIGKSLDRADRAAMQTTTQKALESSKSGNPVKWSNPDSGNSGTVTPQPAYAKEDGAYCREYQQTVTVGGETETAYGTACRQPDGSWKIVSG